MQNLKLIKKNIKNNIWNYEKVKVGFGERYVQIQKDLLQKIQGIQDLNDLTSNFNTDLIQEYMEDFLEIEKIKKYFKIK